MGIFDRLTIESKFAKWKFPLKVFFFSLGMSPPEQKWPLLTNTWWGRKLFSSLETEPFGGLKRESWDGVFHPGQLSIFDPSHGPMLSNHVYLNWLAHDKFTIIRDSGKATGLSLICIHDFISEYDVVIMILIHWTGYLWIDFEPLQNEIV